MNTYTRSIRNRFVQRIPIVILILCGLCTSHLKAQIVAWDFNGNVGNEVSVPSTTTNANLVLSSVTRGSGIQPGNPAITNTFGSESFTDGGDRANAIVNNEYLAFTVTTSPGYFTKFTTLDANFRRSATGPNNFEWQYSLDGTSFTTIGSSFTYNNVTADGDAQAQINLANISAIQYKTTVYFRLYAWGATNVGGTFAWVAQLLLLTM